MHFLRLPMLSLLVQRASLRVARTFFRTRASLPARVFPRTPFLRVRYSVAHPMCHCLTVSAVPTVTSSPPAGSGSVPPLGLSSAPPMTVSISIFFGSGLDNAYFRPPSRFEQFSFITCVLLSKFPPALHLVLTSWLSSQWYRQQQCCCAVFRRTRRRNREPDRCCPLVYHLSLFL